jgi:hypothetical protein
MSADKFIKNCEDLRIDESFSYQVIQKLSKQVRLSFGKNHY